MMTAAPSPLLRGMMLWALYAVPFVVAIRPVAVPVLDPDIWWHLAVGQWVVEHRTVTTLDPFSQIAQPWVAYSWLYEVLVYGLYRAFGLAGIIVYRAVLALLVVSAVHALVCRLERRFLVATGLTAAAVLALTMLFSERPWLFTILFSTLTLHAIVALRNGESPRWVWTLPLVYILWANIHIQFIYGLFLLGLALCCTEIDRLWGRAVIPGRKRIVLLFGLCFLGTFVNPYGFRLYLVVFEYATQPGAFRWVSELKALEFREIPDWTVLTLTLGACYALGGKRWSTFEVLLIASTAFFAFRARRDLWFVVLADLVVLASLESESSPKQERIRLGWGGWACLISGLLLVVAGRVATQNLSPAGLAAAVGQRFPVGAVAHIKEKGYPGYLFNDFNWGGFLIWALPEKPVAIDGRTNFYGDERIERFGQVWLGMDGWHDNPDLIGAGVVIAPVDTALGSLLQLDPRFRQVYEDELSRIFIPAGRKP